MLLESVFNSNRKLLCYFDYHRLVGRSRPIPFGRASHDGVLNRSFGRISASVDDKSRFFLVGGNRHGRCSQPCCSWREPQVDGHRPGESVDPGHRHFDFQLVASLESTATCGGNCQSERTLLHGDDDRSRRREVVEVLSLGRGGRRGQG